MIELFIVGALGLIFVSAALAPMESLGWWAGWGTKPPQKHAVPGEDADGSEPDDEADFYMVYLSGIGATKGAKAAIEAAGGSVAAAEQAA